MAITYRDRAMRVVQRLRAEGRQVAYLSTPVCTAFESRGTDTGYALAEYPISNRAVVEAIARDIREGWKWD